MTPTGPSRIIRARRYVSAPAGLYPPPVPVGGTPAVQAAAQAAATIEAPVADAATIRASADDLAAVGAPRTQAPAPAAVVTPATGRRSPLRRILAMLAGGLIGGSVGVAVGAALLALQDAPRWLDRLSDPRVLWNSADDPIVIGSVAAVVAGFALIGVLWPLRRG
ncbi:MAG: hypothetical protein Kow0062_08680 [Acidobacteriota bacterium]